MKNQLDTVFDRIKRKYCPDSVDDTRNYMEVDIGKEADEMGLQELKEKYHGIHAVIPLKEAVEGMKVRIDGRTFVNYVQFESGIAVPGYLIKDSQLPYKTYVPKDSMICNFA